MFTDPRIASHIETVMEMTAQSRAETAARHDALVANLDDLIEHSLRVLSRSDKDPDILSRLASRMI